MAYFYGQIGVKNTFTGGLENDYAYGQDLADTYSGGFGADTLTGEGGADILKGDKGNDTLSGGAGNDYLDGGSGNDTLTGGAGADKIFGGTGDDVVNVGGVSDMIGDVVDGGVLNGVDRTGVDTLIADFTGRTAALAFTGADPTVKTAIKGAFTYSGFEKFTITGGSGADKITGALLEDTLRGGGGADQLFGKESNDILYGDAGLDKLYGGVGSDLIYGGTENDLLYGGDGNDTLNGDAGLDKLYGEKGADTLNGGEGADTLDGGADNDLVGGGAGIDIVKGGAGDDRISGGDVFYGYGYDTGLDKDNLDGGAGDDIVTVGRNDIAAGGTGVDTAQLNFELSAVGEVLAFSSKAITLKAGAKISGFEVLDFRGGTGADRVAAGALGDTLNGGGGNDSLKGMGGADVLTGGLGDDLLYGGDGIDVLYDDDGKDTLDGGAGDDAFYLISNWNVAPQADTYIGGLGVDKAFINGSVSAVLDLADAKKNDGILLGDKFSGIEQFTLTYVDDEAYGDASANFFFGADGDDILDGRAGADLLQGGAGADVLTGGTGADVFDYTEYAFQQWRGDVITDFSTAQGDKISLGYWFGAKSATSFTLGKEATTAKVSLFFDADTHRLWYDQDGTGTQYSKMLFATLEDVTTLSINDFLFTVA
ncbi:hypothetical protein GCM10008171_05200 [Methylopila jiangsuensis]|uniref:Hemolysin-type calcium-binding repeat-containing protein n=1 Tax=Methylopila jiangsuensis TaxID=586230 RepID=A0A9W6N2I9_9HYPH|nr:calcium-binding protein [Methylopila jiangsuensis]MDR6285508.1 Ca2+-binding RTX toxin-like protein [Methylopila jiangsuensis]GLK75266.1 hypothetical protein GCM10008171_05200 [Methylopila jiangsuensis]